MAGMGPPPKPDGQRRRRNTSIALTQLPAGGRTGRAPRWPLIPDIVTTARRNVWASKAENLEYDLQEADSLGKPSGDIELRLDRAREQLAIHDLRLAEQRKLEATLWRELWRTPQAYQWERLGWVRDVAQYVRHKVLGELGELDDAKEARQWSDRLGLTPLAMLRLRWEVAPDEVAQKRQERTGTTAAARPPRAQDRLRVADPNAVAGS